MTRMVVGAGWHDVCVRWDISTPQSVGGRLNALPGQGSMRQPGKKLFAERDRFGKWQHLGPSHVLLAYVVDSPEYGLIRRLELQTHLVEEVENDLCRPSEFPERWGRVQTRMAMNGVLPPEDPVYVRVDPAVDVVYEDPADGRDVLEALRYARWPLSGVEVQLPKVGKQDTRRPPSVAFSRGGEDDLQSPVVSVARQLDDVTHALRCRA